MSHALQTASGRDPRRVHKVAGAWLLVWAALGPVALASCSEPKLGGPVARGEMVASAALGSGPDDLGAVTPEEANPEGPKSLAAANDERRVFVLDAVNDRIQVFEQARVTRQIPLPAGAFIDVAVLPNDRLALLETEGKGRLVVIDEAGKSFNETVLEGIGVPHPELAGGMVARADGVWLGYRGRYTRVADAQGASDPTRPMLAGLPTRDGKFIVSLSTQGTSLSVLKRERDGLPQNRLTTLHFEQPLIHTLAYDTDDAGNLYLITLHIWGKGSEQQAKTLLTVLSPELSEQKHLTLPTPQSAFEVTRYADITRAGSVHYLDLSRTSALVRKFL